MATKEKEKKIDIDEELAFWNSREFGSGSEAELIKRFKKIRNESVNDEIMQAIIDNIRRVIPDERKPLFYLKLFIETPKKETTVSRKVKNLIKDYCKSQLIEMGMDESSLSSVGVNLFRSENPERFVNDFIDGLIAKNADPQPSNADVLALSYMWLVLTSKDFRPTEHWKTVIIIERVMVNRYGSEKEKDLRECVLKAVPGAIADGQFGKKFLHISYLYKDQQPELMKLRKESEDSQKHIQNLLSESRKAQEKIDKKEVEIKELKEQLNNASEECSRLQKDLQLSENRLKQEGFRFEQQYISKEQNLMEEVKAVIGSELQGIADLADRLSDKERNRLLHYLERIEERIAGLGGSSNA